MKILRGEIYRADLSPNIGSEQGGIRPVLIIQNDKGNLASSTTIVAAITSLKKNKKKLPTHVKLPATLSGLVSDSIIECEQIRTVDKLRLKEKLSAINSIILENVDKALGVSLYLKINNKEEKTHE